jgi:cytochrome P450
VGQDTRCHGGSILHDNCTGARQLHSYPSCPKTFSAGNAQTPIKPLAPAVVEALQTGGLQTRPVIPNADPPVHTRIRKFTWQAFTPKRIAQLEPEVRRLVSRFLGQIEGERRVDLVRRMFYELPVPP